MRATCDGGAGESPHRVKMEQVKPVVGVGTNLRFPVLKLFLTHCVSSALL